MSTHQCIHASPPQPSYHTQAVQSISQYLDKKGWKKTHLTFGTIAGDFLQTTYNVYLHFSDWQAAWKAAGFHDVTTEEGYQQLKEALKTSTYAPPLILLNPLVANSSIWNPWIPELKNGQAANKIGHVIIIQLPDDIESADPILRNTLSLINGLYQEAFARKTPTLMDIVKDSAQNPIPNPVPINVVGDSSGGYKAHLASFTETHLFDDQKIQRRWHNNVRNPLVGKVVALVAPTWLCQDGCKDGNDIYPEHGFTEEQKKHLEKTHEHIFDVIATEDAISPTSSPLPNKQVVYVQHTHQGIICPEVCKKVIELINS